MGSANIILSIQNIYEYRITTGRTIWGSIPVTVPGRLFVSTGLPLNGCRLLFRLKTTAGT